jgi:hypothetical protein
VLFSLLDYNSPALQRMLTLCKQHGVVIIAYSVLVRALLLGVFVYRVYFGAR